MRLLGIACPPTPPLCALPTFSSSIRNQTTIQSIIYRRLQIKTRNDDGTKNHRFPGWLARLPAPPFSSVPRSHSTQRKKRSTASSHDLPSLVHSSVRLPLFLTQPSRPGFASATEAAEPNVLSSQLSSPLNPCFLHVHFFMLHVITRSTTRDGRHCKDCHRSQKKTTYSTKNINPNQQKVLQIHRHALPSNSEFLLTGTSLRIM